MFEDNDFCTGISGNHFKLLFPEMAGTDFNFLISVAGNSNNPEHGLFDTLSYFLSCTYVDFHVVFLFTA